jgi:PAS domain S-box-containing protein
MPVKAVSPTLGAGDFQVGAGLDDIAHGGSRMAQQEDIFERRIEAVQERIGALLGRAGTSPELRKEAAEVLETLSTSLEELQVVGEELRQQNEELMAARQTLERERRRYQELFELAPDGYLVTDTHGVIGEANRAAATLLQVPQDWLAGKPLAIYVSKEQRRDFMALLARLNEVERAEDWEVRLQPRRGEPFPAAISVAGAYDVAGRLVGFRWLLRDIKQQVQVQEALRANEKEFRAMFELNAVGMAQVDPDSGRFVRVNRKLCEISGYAEQELLGATFSQLTHPDDRDADMALYQSVLRGESDGWTSQKRYIRKDGACIWVEVVGTTIYDAAGRPYRSIAVVQDVTQRKEAEESLRESEVRYRELADSIADVFFALDEQLRYTYWNPASERLTGISAEDAIGKSLYEVFPDTAQTRKAESLYQDVLRTGRPQSLVNEYDMGGKTQFFEIRAYPARGGLSVFVQDITQRVSAEQALQNSEQKFRSVVEQSPDAIALVDESGHVVEWNPAAEEMLGLKQAGVLGRPIWDVQFEVALDEQKSPVAYGQLKAAVLNMLQTGRMPDAGPLLERDIRRPDGAQRTIQSLVFPIRTRQGFLLGSMTRDVTERRREQQERERLLAEIMRNQESIAELAASLELGRDTLQTIMENTHAQLAYLDPDFNFIRANSAYALGSGHSQEDLIGHNHFELFPNAENQAIFERVRDTGRAVQFQARPFEYADQPERGVTYWDWSLVPVKGGSIGVQGLVLSLTEVTDRVRAEQEHERHWARLDRLIRISQALLAEDTVEGVLQLVVDGARELAGAGLSKAGYNYQAGVFQVGAVSGVEGLSPDLTKEIFGPAHTAVYLDLIREEPAIRLTEAQLRAHPALRGRPEGHRLMRGLLGARLIDGDGQPNGLIWISDKEEGDFTPEDQAVLVQLATLSSLALQHIEAREAVVGWIAELDATIAALADGVMVYSPSGEIVRTNQAADRMLGSSALERGLAWDEWMRLLRVETAEAQPVSNLEDLPSRRALRGETVSNEVMAIRHADSGERVWLSVSAAPILSPDGKLLGAVVSLTDISELRRARDELELRVRERTAELVEANRALEYQAYLLANVNDAIIASDERGCVTAWNRAAEDMFGWAAAEVFGRPWTEFVTMASADIDPAGMAPSLVKRGRWRGEIRFHHRDGAALVSEINVMALKDEAGHTTGFVAVSRDVTENKHAQEALRESEGRFRQLAENIEQVFWMWDPDRTEIFYVSPAYEAIWGRSCQSLYQEPRSFVEAIHPADRRRVLTQYQRYKRAGYEVDYRVVRPDGSMRWVRDRAFPIRNDEGRVYRIAGITEDITARKQAEDALRESETAYRTLAENLPGVVYRVFIREGNRMQFFNRVAEAVTGYAGEELGLGVVCSIDPLILPEDRPGVIAEVEWAISEDRPFSVEYRLKHKDGGIRYLLEQGVPIRGLDGEPLYIDGVIFDITERIESQEALRESEERFKAQYKGIPIPTYTWQATDGDFVLVDYNDAARSVTQDRIASSVGSPASQLFADRPDILHDMAQCFRDRRVIRRETDYASGYSGVQGVFTVSYAFAPPDLVMVHVEDITERKRAEEALRQQALIIDQVHDSVIATDLNGYVISWNQGAQRLTGYSVEEALGQHISFLYPEDQHAFLEQGVIAPLKAKGHHETEVLMNNKAGRVFYAHLSLSLLRDSGGTPTGMIGYSMDISERKQAEEELKARGRQQVALTELAQQALLESDLSAVMDLAVEKVSDILDVEYCKVLELLPEGQAFLLRAGVGWRAGLVGQVTIDAGRDSQAGYTLLHGQPVVVEDLRRETRFTGPALLTDHAVISGVSVIIHGQEQPFGVLGAHTSTRRTFSEDEIYFLQTVAHILATAIQRKRAEEIVQQYVLRLEVMRKIDQAILAARSPEEIAEVTLRYIRRLSVPCQFASVVLFDFEAGEVLRLALNGEEGTGFPGGKSFSLDLLGDITPLQQGQPVIENDLQRLPSRPPIQERLLVAGLHSYMGVPLLFQDELIGSLNLAASSPHAFGTEHAEIVRHVADPLAIAIQNARLFDQVRAGRERLQILSQRLVEAQEAERQRVSAELHDEAGQALTALKISLELMQSDLPPGSEAVRQSMHEAMLLTEQTMEQVRLLARGLRPPSLDAVGLNPTLEDYCRDFARVTRLAVEYSGVDLPALSDAAMITVYRVVQEGLTNVAKHARASRVWVTLRQDANQVSLSVEDDGKGFDREAAEPAADHPWGIGLLGMQERLELLGGWLEVTSWPGRGTRLVARIPWREML